MPLYEHGETTINYEDTGSGFPLLIIPGGGLNSTMSFLAQGAPFNPMSEFRNDFRCIVADLRNATGGESFGPLELDHPCLGSYTDDHLGLMDHLGIEQFMVIGFCIGGPMCWNLLRRAEERVLAAVLAQPSGFRPEFPNLFYDNNVGRWVPGLLARHPEVTAEMARTFLRNLYGTDFVFTVTREFVGACQTPLLVLPDDIPEHPCAVAMEMARLAPKAQVSLYPWKEPQELVPLAVRHIRMFLQVHRP